MPDQVLVNSDLQSALDEARQAYAGRNPKSLTRQQEACEAMPGGNTRTTLHNSPFPLTVVRGDGCRLWDADGHEYIDVLGEYTAGIYGHSHPVIRAAIDRALDHGWNFAGRNVNEGKLAKLVVDRMPSIDLVRFTNSGTEGNVMALAGARVYAQRKGRTRATKVMVFHGGYHGGVLYFVSGGSPVNMPYEYIVAPYNDVEGTRALLARHGEELFAVLLEPMQGSRMDGAPVLIPILRAGLGMLAAAQQILPEASIGYIGLARDEATAEAKLYYCNLPDLTGKTVLLLDPMLATGGSAVSAAQYIYEAGASRVLFVCVVAAPEGVESLQKAHPNIEIIAGALDRQLNAEKYILPGLGDFGDRLFGT